MRSLTLPDEAFRALAHRLADFSADYIESTAASFPPIRPASAATQTQSLFSGDIPWEGEGAAAFDSLADVFRLSRPASPRFFGYVFGSGEPVGALGEFATAVLHQNAAAWRSAPAGVTIERTVVGWLASAIGCPGFTGSLTLGGSSANLMGLCMAREAKAPANQRGVRGGVIYCSTEAHMSIAKAAALLGLGYDAVRLIPVDKAFRMRIDDLRRAITSDLDAGKIPIAVVASAGTTATGSIDPLARRSLTSAQNSVSGCMSTARMARSRRWLFLMPFAAWSAPIRSRSTRTSGSISPPAADACSTAMRRRARRAFSHSGDYARALSDDPIEGFAIFEESIELSRPVRALKLWLSLRYYGLRAFQAVDSRGPATGAGAGRGH